MFTETDNADPRVTLIDNESDDTHVIHNFYGRHEYGKEGKLGVYHDNMPDSLDDAVEGDMDGWGIVVTEKVSPTGDETETVSGMVEVTDRRSDGWFIRFE